MKRYRLLSGTFIDTTRNILRSDTPGNPFKAGIEVELREQYGAQEFKSKLARYVEVSPPWMRVLWPNLSSEQQVYDAYVAGSYYPSLTGACCLTEAVLGTLITRLRSRFIRTPEYKRVRAKESFQDWRLAIRVLNSWGIIDDEMAGRLRLLHKVRNEAIHVTELENVRTKALDALNTYSDLVSNLFGASEETVFWCPGEIYIKRDKETDPVVQEFFIPRCSFVGYKHRTEQGAGNNFRYIDEYDYESYEIDDKEFRERRVSWGERQSGTE